MNKRSVFCSSFMILLVLSACDYSTAKPIFDIYGSPSPLYYGGSCPTPVLTLLVSGPGEGLGINSIIAAYQLFDGSGKKIREDSYSLNPIPDTPPFTYGADRIITVPDGGGSTPDSPILDFGEGRVDFAATVYAKILSPAPTGPGETYYFTSTKSIPVLPCGSTKVTATPPLTRATLLPILPPGLESGTLIAPGPYDRPTQESGGDDIPPAPPSCSVEPNNPSCVP